MRMDALHYALLAVLVLLVFYAASTYGLFKEAETLKQTSMINERGIKRLVPCCPPRKITRNAKVPQGLCDPAC